MSDLTLWIASEALNRLLVMQQVEEAKASAKSKQETAPIGPQIPAGARIAPEAAVFELQCLKSLTEAKVSQLFMIMAAIILHES